MLVFSCELRTFYSFNLFINFDIIRSWSTVVDRIWAQDSLVSRASRACHVFFGLEVVQLVMWSVCLFLPRRLNKRQRGEHVVGYGFPTYVRSSDANVGLVPLIVYSGPCVITSPKAGVTIPTCLTLWPYLVPKIFCKIFHILYHIKSCGIYIEH